MPPYPGVDKFPMEFSYFKPRYLPRSGKHYALIGFPATKSAVDSSARTVLAVPYAYRSDPIDDTEYAAHGLTPESHVLLPLDLKKGFDIAGRVRAFPKPQGMSGSPIIVLYEDIDASRAFPVVAVATRYRKHKKLLIGTDIDVATRAIEHLMSRPGRAGVQHD